MPAPSFSTTPSLFSSRLTARRWVPSRATPAECGAPRPRPDGPKRATHKKGKAVEVSADDPARAARAATTAAAAAGHPCRPTTRPRPKRKGLGVEAAEADA